MDFLGIFVCDDCQQTNITSRAKVRWSLCHPWPENHPVLCRWKLHWKTGIFFWPPFRLPCRVLDVLGIWCYFFIKACCLQILQSPRIKTSGRWWVVASSHLLNLYGHIMLYPYCIPGDVGPCPDMEYGTFSETSWEHDDQSGQEKESRIRNHGMHLEHLLYIFKIAICNNHGIVMVVEPRS